MKATLNHNSIWASSVDVLDREERCVDDDEASGGSKSHPLVNLVSWFKLEVARIQKIGIVNRESGIEPALVLGIGSIPQKKELGIEIPEESSHL